MIDFTRHHVVYHSLNLVVIKDEAEGDYVICDEHGSVDSEKHLHDAIRLTQNFVKNASEYDYF